MRNFMGFLLFLLALAIVFSGCATSSIESLQVGLDHCNLVNQQGWTEAIEFAVCHDQTGKAIGMASGTALSRVDIAAKFAGPVAVVVGAGILASQFDKINTGTSDVVVHGAGTP